MGCAGSVWRALGPYFDPAAPVSGGTGSLANEFVTITSGGNHSCALDANDKAFCWGSNNTGQSGQSSSAFVSVPTEVSAGGSWLEVVAHHDSATGIRSDGTLRWWGLSSTGINNNAASPNTWKTARPTYGAVCAIRSDDTMWCRNGQSTGTNSGFMGYGSFNNTTSWVQVSGGHLWKALDVTQNFNDEQAICAIKSDDTIWCWGNDNSGKLGNGAIAGNQNVPGQIDDASTWKAITGGQNYFCAIKSDDTGWCWGQGSNGRLGDGSGSNQASPVQIAGGHNWKVLSAGVDHTCGIKTDDTLWCWGSQTNGKVGNGLTSGSQATPVQVQVGNTFKAVSAGSSFTCAIASNNARYCWGNNNDSQLGSLLVPTAFTEPVAIADPATYSAVSVASGTGASEAAVCAIRTSGALYCWGDNASGRLGNGTTTSTATATQVSGGGVWKSVFVMAMSARHTCGIKDDDTLWCWGSNNRGQLGLGTVGGSQTTPQQVGTATWARVRGYADMNNDSARTCGIRLDGSLWCWGAQTSGRLGNGQMSGETGTPENIAPGETFIDVSLGTNFTCAVNTDTSLWCWGANYTATPTEVTVAGTGWKTINMRPGGGGDISGAGTKSDDSVWILGGETDGADAGTVPDLFELPAFAGAGTSQAIKMSRNGWTDILEITPTNQLFVRDWPTDPAVLEHAGNWIDVSNGRSAACGIKSDFRVYCWGDYGFYLGQPTISVTSPDAVLGDCGNPPTQAGGFRYNGTFDVMTYCDGIGYSAVGK
jgi:alpha-tubulin suppressor-like RCC1 family protein